MKHLYTLMAAALVFAVGALMGDRALAHGPPRLKTEQSIVVDASVEEVWAVVGRFDDMSWHPATASVSGGTGTEKGATRERTFVTGQVVAEELTKYDPVKHAISVRFMADDTAALMATNYAAHITLADEGGKTRITLRGAFYRGFPQNEPPADMNDDASTAAVEAYHQAGLDALAARFGHGGS